MFELGEAQLQVFDPSLLRDPEPGGEAVYDITTSAGEPFSIAFPGGNSVLERIPQRVAIQTHPPCQLVGESVGTLGRQSGPAERREQRLLQRSA